MSPMGHGLRLLYSTCSGSWGNNLAVKKTHHRTQTTLSESLITFSKSPENLIFYLQLQEAFSKTGFFDNTLFSRFTKATLLVVCLGEHFERTQIGHPV